MLWAPVNRRRLFRHPIVQGVVMTSSTGQTQQHSQLWSAAPRDWADNELLCTPVYEAVFDAVDVVTSFNAVQYAADPVAALREAARTTVHSGRVVIATWGGPQRCESRFAMAALRDLMPPPPGAGGPFALSAPGKLEELAEAAGLSPERVDDAPVTF